MLTNARASVWETEDTYRAGDGVRIQLPLELRCWPSHLCRTSREASWVRQLCASHLRPIVGRLKKIKKERRNDSLQTQVEESLTISHC